MPESKFESQEMSPEEKQRAMEVLREAIEWEPIPITGPVVESDDWEVVVLLREISNTLERIEAGIEDIAKILAIAENLKPRKQKGISVDRVLYDEGGYHIAESDV